MDVFSQMCSVNLIFASPGAMALAATGSLELAEKVTAASATEMRLAGINWAYSPVADVNSDSRNPVIGKAQFLWATSFLT
jgi:beta-glucosidase-like glycosyl hydrolase